MCTVNKLQLLVPRVRKNLVGEIVSNQLTCNTPNNLIISINMVILKLRRKGNIYIKLRGYDVKQAGTEQYQAQEKL